jgi:cell division protein FtsL
MAVLKNLTGLARRRLASLFGRSRAGDNDGRRGPITAVILVASLLFLGLFYVWTRMKVVQIGYEIADLEKENNALKNRKREMLLEITSLQSPGELEKQARNKVGLAFPPLGKVVHVP